MHLCGWEEGSSVPFGLILLQCSPNTDSWAAHVRKYYIINVFMNECCKIRRLKTITPTKTLYLPPTKFFLTLRNVYYQIINLLKSQQWILIYIYIYIYIYIKTGNTFSFFHIHFYLIVLFFFLSVLSFFPSYVFWFLYNIMVF